MTGLRNKPKCLIMFMLSILHQEDYRGKLGRRILKNRMYILLKELLELRPSRLLPCFKLCLFLEVGSERKGINRFFCLRLLTLTPVDIFKLIVFAFKSIWKELLFVLKSITVFQASDVTSFKIKNGIL